MNNKIYGNGGEAGMLVLAILSMVVMFVIGYNVGSSYKNFVYKRDLIDRNLVKYISDPKTGDTKLIWISDGAIVKDNN